MAKSTFTQLLMQWCKTHRRDLPWKGEKDPYLIWLSEIILQQTRVEQGWPYFERFKRVFPSIHDLARAPEDKVMKLWQGLGYYSRARNLHATARYISSELNGDFPNTYPEILSLKGVGPYTAAAIASFAYGLPHAVVDGNVYRVLSRYFDIDTPIDSTEGKARFKELAQSLLDVRQPGVYNQAVMDFGATVCLPVKPNCTSCPMHKSCKALRLKKVTQLPVKSKKLVRKERHFNYLVIFDKNGQTLVNKRQQKDIWRNLYEFPLIETTMAATLESLQKTTQWNNWLGEKRLSVIPSQPIRQTLTHQYIFAVFWEIEVDRLSSLPIKQLFLPVEKGALKNYAFPRVIDRYVEAAFFCKTKQ